MRCHRHNIELGRFLPDEWPECPECQREADEAARRAAEEADGQEGNIAMSWGRGWQVGVRKAIWAHERSIDRAAEILAQEHGTRHKPGERPDLCPKCRNTNMRLEERSAAE